MMEAEKLRSQGVDIADFGAGEPDFPTPENVKEAAIRAIQGVGLKVRSIHDITPVPHNGCRPPKRRRV